MWPSVRVSPNCNTGHCGLRTFPEYLEPSLLTELAYYAVPCHVDALV